MIALLQDGGGTWRYPAAYLISAAFFFIIFWWRKRGKP
jgi:hypothetical protein